MPAIPRVCHVVIALEPGGLERLVVDWTNARNDAHPGSTVICCLDAAGALASEVPDGAIGVLGAHRGRFPWDRAAIRRLRAWLQNPPTGEPFAVVHSHNLAAQQYAALAARGTTLRHVHTEHGSNVHVHGWKHRLRQRLLARAAQLLVAVSPDTAARMAPVWGLPQKQIRVIPNGVASHAPAGADAVAALRREWHIPAGALVIGAVGRLAHVKGYDRLLAALPAILAQVPETFCVLVGEGPERAALEAQAKRLKLQGHVHFAGFRRDARACYEAFDVYVAPSRSEGLPVALLEAMAAGCPAVVTDVGEQRAVLADGAAGVILPPDERDWAAVLARCLQGPGRVESRRLAACARQRVAEHYSLTSTLAAYEAAYQGGEARA